MDNDPNQFEETKVLVEEEKPGMQSVKKWKVGPAKPIQDEPSPNDSTAKREIAGGPSRELSVKKMKVGPQKPTRDSTGPNEL